MLQQLQTQEAASVIITKITKGEFGAIVPSIRNNSPFTPEITKWGPINKSFVFTWNKESIRCMDKKDDKSSRQVVVNTKQL